MEYEDGPIGLDERWPRLSWRNEAGIPAQTAYQIQVSRGGIAGSGAPSVVWDSGRVDSADCALVDYSGADLVAFAEYEWRVRCWYGTESPGRWSCGRWAMGPLDGADWGDAQWISGETAPADAVRPAPLLRRTFGLAKPKVLSATLFVSGLGYATCYLNGRRVGHDVLQPAPTNYGRTVLFNTYDVTDLVQAGTNCLAAELGRGRFADLTPNVWRWHQAPWVGQPRLLALLRIVDSENEVTSIITDPHWCWLPGPTVTDSLFRGETYDARLAKAGWTDPEFPDGEWQAVTPVDGPQGRVRSQRVQPICITERVAPTAVRTVADGVSVFDFGRQFAGRVVISGSGLSAGATTHITHAEKVDSDGRAVTEQRHVEPPIQTDVVVSAGPIVHFQPQFSYKGFRFAQVESDAEAATWELAAEVLHNDVASSGDFECSNQDLNLIHRASRSSILSNLHGIPTDTPVYEKNGWTADAHLSMGAAIANFDMARLYTKWLDDLADSQREDGEIPPIAPTSGDPGWGYSDSGVGVVAPQPSWDVAYPEVAWALWQYYGDRRVLQRHYPNLLRYLPYIETYLDQYVFRGGLGDWWPPNHPARRREDADLHQTAYVARWAQLVGRIAGTLGDEAGSRRCRDLRTSVVAAFHRTFFQCERGWYAAAPGGPFRQAANAVPIGLGITPERLRAGLVEAIAADLRQRDNHPDVGVIGIKQLLPVLTSHGHHELAVEAVTVRGYPGLLRWFDDGVVSLHEGWDDDARSHNHHYFASVDQWLYESVLGVTPVEPAYRHVCIAPHLSPTVAWARGHITTPFGELVIEWEISNGGGAMSVQVPHGTSASVNVATDQGTAAAVRCGHGRHEFGIVFDQAGLPSLRSGATDR